MASTSAFKGKSHSYSIEYTNTKLIESAADAKPTRQYGCSYLLEAVQSFEKEKKAGNPRDELTNYLEAGVEVVSDIISWWGVSTSRNTLKISHIVPQHQTDSKYPTLKRIARDFLAIQGSSTPSERAFSSGGITGSNRRSSLTTEMFQALQILKSAYRNGHISAATQASQHLDALLISLDSATDEDGGL